MHAACLDFCRRVKAAFPAAFASGRVLEIGSLNVNGSARELFDRRCQYIGLDRQQGPGVNRVRDGAKTGFRSASFDVVYSTETLEHATDWRAVLAEMHRVIKPGGLLFVTAATTGREVHGFNEFGDGHYENVKPDELRALIEGRIILWEEDYSACDVRAAWIRPPAGR